ncbi:B3 domain-containing protein [Thalictrum thalictroides]|uniref:B3 domain-containing protein n=1 Tax=Thalictrum thalictroides TaxID=46969 RepID=A0A7J6UXH1_THATH|nr:B3 domain-containing protein [Thalictrum thalictroides]
MVKGGTDQIISEDMKQPEFFKIIHASLGNTQQLRIPPDFLKHIADEDSGIAVLEGPSATYDWHVRFCKKEGGTFLTEGWNDFVRDNALGEYEFLVFRYQGNMCFHVEIYAKSGCKKEDSGGNIQGIVGSTSYRGRGRPPKNALLSQIRGKVRNGRLPTEEEKEKVLKSALSFTFTLHLPNFMRCLYASCVYTSYVLNIPSDFAKAYLPKYKSEIVLQGRNGRSWSVTCNPGKRQYTFCGGWTCFVHENQLNAGDSSVPCTSEDTVVDSDRASAAIRAIANVISSQQLKNVPVQREPFSQRELEDVKAEDLEGKENGELKGVESEVEGEKGEQRVESET